MKEILFQLAAAITFFTRFPLWRIVNIPAVSFKKIICFWPLTGWITSGLTALAWWMFSLFLPTYLALILAFAFRVLLTGGLHEDGLGDFFDGFGGGSTKEDVLRIMKDSHVGSYALIGMIFYYLLLIGILNETPDDFIAISIFVADPFSKMLTALMMNLLPYARLEHESKTKTLSDKLNIGRVFAVLFFGLLPFVIFLDTKFWLTVLAPIITVTFIYLFVKRRIGGYTGDVCGAAALLCELSFYISLYVFWSKL